MDELRELHANATSTKSVTSYTNLPIRDIITLLREGLDVRIDNHYDKNRILAALEVHIEGIELFIPLLKGIKLNVPITMNPKSFSLLRKYDIDITVELTIIIRISQIDNYIANSPTPVQVLSNNDILIEYLTWKFIPYQVIISRTTIIRYNEIDHLSRLSEESIFNLLWLSVMNGREDALIAIMEFGYTPPVTSDDWVRSCTERNDYSLLLSIKYNEYLRLSHRISEMLLILSRMLTHRLIDIDRWMLTDPSILHHWKKLKVEHLNEITDYRLLAELRDLSLVDITIESVLDEVRIHDTRTSTRPYMRLDEVELLITSDTVISKENIQFLIDNMGNSNSVVALLVKLCHRGIINISEYYGSNPEVDYLISQSRSTMKSSSKSIRPPT